MAEHHLHPFTSVDGELAVLQVILARRARARVFGADLFSDPGWDILLALFLARLRQQRMTSGQLSREIALSPNLTARWIDTLDQHGLVRLRSDLGDSQRISVELSGKGMDGMRDWLEIARVIETDSDTRVIDLLSRIRDNGD